MRDTLAILGLLCIAAQAPVTSHAQVANYNVRKIFPDVFPVLPTIPWPPVRVLNQNRMLVAISNAPLPDAIEFLDMNGLLLVLPVTGAVQVSPNEWELTTPMAMVPHILSGTMGITAIHTGNGTRSNMRRALLP